jgi:endonuclease YncB( thermonuclease family)
LTLLFQTPFEFWYQARVISVTDGDTIVLNIDLGRRHYSIDSIRLIGVNARELSQPGGHEAADYLRTLCPEGLTVRFQTFKNKSDKYGRWLGRVYLPPMVDLNQMMVDAGHAVVIKE